MSIDQTTETALSESDGALHVHPSREDFFQIVRLLDEHFQHAERVGTASTPEREPIRIYQNNELDWAPSTVQSLEATADFARIGQRFFGLLGPNGPMPVHVSEEVRHRSRHECDQTTEDFLNLFNHRMATLFYRAWADGRPSVQQDRPSQDRFREYLLSLSGTAVSDSVHQHASATESHDSLRLNTRAHFAGRFANQARNVEGLQAVLTSLLNVPVAIKQYALQYLSLTDDSQTTLGRKQPNQLGTCKERSGVLGKSAVLGRRVPDRSCKINVAIGPLGKQLFDLLIPGAHHHHPLCELIRDYIGQGLNCRVTLKLEKRDCPAVRLGTSGALGVTSWIQPGADREQVEDCHFEV